MKIPPPFFYFTIEYSIFLYLIVKYLIFIYIKFDLQLKCNR